MIDGADQLLPAWTGRGVLVALLALAGAALVHWTLQRAGRRLAVTLAQRARGAEGATDSRARFGGAVERALLPPILAAWVAALYVVSEQFPLLRQWRLLVVCLVQEGFGAPLFKMGEMSYSALDLVLLPTLLIALWIGMGLATRAARLVFFRASAMQSGAQETLGVLTRVVLTFIGAVVVFQYWGIDLSSLTVLGGALGVGIGFGLQTIANNFVSGVVLGLERPIKPGDYVQVGALVGTVTRIGARSTEIRTSDRVAILVPNSTLLEHEVVNWSHEDPTSRLHLPVQVAYGSDLRTTRAALLEVARSHPDVLADPRPDVQLRGLGENGLDVELLVWTRDPRRQVELTSALYFRIVPALRRHGIEVPSPQRDVTLHAPEIDRAVAAWRRQSFPESDDAAMQNGHVPIDDAVAAADGRADDLGPPAWDDRALAGVVDRMRAPDGVPILDRRHLLRVYPRCFVGREAVDWLTRHERLTRDEAVMLGQRLVARGIVHHVLDEHDFKDDGLYYRFRADEEPARRGAAAGI